MSQMYNAVRMTLRDGGDCLDGNSGAANMKV